MTGIALLNVICLSHMFAHIFSSLDKHPNNKPWFAVFANFLCVNAPDTVCFKPTCHKEVTPWLTFEGQVWVNWMAKGGDVPGREKSMRKCMGAPVEPEGPCETVEDFVYPGELTVMRADVH